MECLVEFYAYNISDSHITSKMYIRPPKYSFKVGDKTVTLNENQVEIMYRVFKNDISSFYNSNRYSLFDLSFRDCSDSKVIGFSFNDQYDSFYLNPEELFISLPDFELEPYINRIKKIQNCIFDCQPMYNPIFMIGFVMKGIALETVKAYIRYDISETPNIIDRVKIVNRIVKSVNPSHSSEHKFQSVVTNLEELGFIFSFTGIDYSADSKLRYKLYFRYYGKSEQHLIKERLAQIFPLDNWNQSIEFCFNQHKNGLWGLALSSLFFNDVNGIQLYFFP